MSSFSTKTTPDGKSKKKVYSHFCPYCPRSFTCPHNVMQHINEQHRMDRDHKCSECPAAFARPWTLSRHLLNVHNIDTRPGRGKPGQRRKRSDDPALARRVKKLKKREHMTHHRGTAAPAEFSDHVDSTEDDDDDDNDYAEDFIAVHPNGKNLLIQDYNVSNAIVSGGNEDLSHPHVTGEPEGTYQRSTTGFSQGPSYYLQVLKEQDENQILDFTVGQSKLSNLTHTSDYNHMELLRIDDSVAERVFHDTDQSGLFDETVAGTNKEEDSYNTYPLSTIDEGFMSGDNDTIAWLDDAGSHFGGDIVALMAEAEDILSRL